MDNSKDKMINNILNVRISNTKIKTDGTVNICLEISGDYGFVNDAFVILNSPNSQETKQIKLNYLWTENNINYFTCNLHFGNTGLFWFSIKIIINNNEKWVSYNGEPNTETIGDYVYKMWSITVYDKNFEVPSWAKGKVMYHIFVDRFYKSKNYKPKKIKNRITKKWGETPGWQIDDDLRKNNLDFFMGNLKGIEEKIPYLKSLGVKIIYLSPIFKSQSNHRYDVSDYENVDPYLGDNSDLKNVCSKAHRNGMKIILDGVFNHTGNDSIYFNEYGNYKEPGAYQGKDSPYYEWYKKDNNGNFEYWWGFKNLPVCDGNDKAWQNYIHGKNGIIDKWFKLGIDGLRLDVSDELEDEFIENVRVAVKRNKKDGFIIGEVWENAVTKEKNGKRREYLLGKGLDTVMNYPFTNAILRYVRYGDYNFFTNTVNEIINQYPDDAINSLMNSLSTHDITRVITTLVAEGIEEDNYLIWNVKHDRKWQLEHDNLTKEEYEKAKKMLKIAATIQYFVPGNSCIFYGDEIGMSGYSDPFNRKCFEWENIDNDLNDFFIKLGKIKNNNSFLEDAKFKIEYIDTNYLVFERYNEEKKITIIVNRTNKKIDLEKLKNILKGKILLENNASNNSISEYGFLIVENKK